MKKLFILCALVAGSLSTTATNNLPKSTIVEDFGSCTVIVTQTNSDGEITGTAIHTVYGVDSQAQCDSEADKILTLYQIGALEMN